MANRSREEVRRAREEKVKKAKRQLLMGIIAGVVLVAVIVIIAVSCSKKSGKKDNKKGESTTEQVAETYDISITPVVSNVLGQVSLTWEADANATSYVIYRSDSEDGEYAEVGNSTSAEYTDSSAKKRKTYFYEIQAVKGEGESAVKSNMSTAVKAYVLPKTPKIAIAGECYVVGIDTWAKDKFPEGTLIMGTEGATTYKLINESNYTHNGSNVTALERIAIYKPDIVYFLVGMNEAASGNAPDTIANFQTIVDKLKSVKENIKVVVMAVSPTGKTSSLNIPTVDKRNEFNKSYSGFAETNDNCYFCDYCECIQDEEGYLTPEADGGDGCHWTMQATTAVADYMNQWASETIYAGN